MPQFLVDMWFWLNEQSPVIEAVTGILTILGVGWGIYRYFRRKSDKVDIERQMTKVSQSQNIKANRGSQIKNVIQARDIQAETLYNVDKLIQTSTSIDPERQPNLEIEYDNCWPYCQPSPNNDSAPYSYFVRLMIINNGNELAEQCRGFLASIEDEDGSVRLDYQQTELCWERQSGQPFPRDIPGGHQEFLDVIQTVQGETEFRLRVGEKVRAEINQVYCVEYPSGEYYLTIKIFANNISKPVSQRFRVNWKGQYDKITMAKA